MKRLDLFKVGSLVKFDIPNSGMNGRNINWYTELPLSTQNSIIKIVIVRSNTAEVCMLNGDPIFENPNLSIQWLRLATVAEIAKYKLENRL